MAARLGVPIDNLPGAVSRVFARRFVEQGADTYTWDLYVPAYSLISNIWVYGEALWDAATSASLDIGDYTTAATPVAIDADGFVAQVDLKATDLLAGESLNFGAGGAAADIGAYLDGTATHFKGVMSTVDRWLRSQIVSVGAGSAGRTVVYVQLQVPIIPQASGLVYP